MKIVVLDGYTANPGDLSWDELAELGELTVYDRTPADQILTRIGDAEVVFTNKTPLTRQTIAACPCLKMIGVLATGYDIADIAAAAERGIVVCNIPAYSTDSVAQMTFALLLELCQHPGAHSDACLRGQWTSSPDYCFWLYPLRELAGKTFGIIGYGSIGQAVGRIARAFGMRLLVYTRHPGEDADQFVPLPTLLAQSDVISLHCPHTKQTENLICRDTLAQMKDGAILINTARGALLDEQAVAEALKSGKLAAAGLDVLRQEPPAPDHPLLHAPNCILTPHIAWAPLEARRRLLHVAAENLRAFLNGTPIHVVN